MKKRLNSIFPLFFMATILIGIGYNLYAGYNFHSDKTVLSVQDNFDESEFTYEVDFFGEDQFTEEIDNNIFDKLNLEKNNFKNSFLLQDSIFTIWQPPKNFA